MYLATALTWIAVAAALPSPAELGTRPSKFYTLFAKRDGDSGHGAPLHSIRNGSHPEILLVTGHKHSSDSAQVSWIPTSAGPRLALDHNVTTYGLFAFDQPAAAGRTNPVRAIQGYSQGGWWQSPDGDVVSHSLSGANEFFLCKAELDDQKGHDHDEEMLSYGMDQANGRAPKHCKSVQLHLVPR
ncbi:hypothetical protein AC578_1369 [Pseudocercospora eumusae]|uniref:Cellobiose dehydrogenase cytochrome domain-containing protein n=1 Tax=Pseudocercospora eumusae TaxID=321146 RepID=A0A139HUX1_9PEZI|nr:hypothetical protein AC578_1369 [Pseudocercospora eumusae]